MRVLAMQAFVMIVELCERCFVAGGDHTSIASIVVLVYDSRPDILETYSRYRSTNPCSLLADVAKDRREFHWALAASVL